MQSGRHSLWGRWSAVLALVAITSFALTVRAEEAATVEGRRAAAETSAEPSEADAPPQSPSESTAPAQERSIVRKAGEATFIFGRDTVLDTARIFMSPLGWSGKQWMALGAVGATTGLLLVADKDIRKRAQSSEGFKDFGETMHKLSNGPLTGGVMGAFALSGMVLDRPQDVTTARLALQSTLVTGVVVIGLKSALGRARPRDNTGPYDFAFFGGNHSMPSGEVATAFAIAQVVAERYKNWPARILAYGAAMTVAAGRIGDDAHWASDVFLGAATGIAISHAIMRYDARRKKKKDIELSVMPGGFLLTYHF